MRRITCQCDTFFDVNANPEQYELSAFTFEDLEVNAVDKGASFDAVSGMIVDNVTVVIEEKEGIAANHQGTWCKDRPWEA